MSLQIPLPHDWENSQNNILCHYKEYDLVEMTSGPEYNRIVFKTIGRYNLGIKKVVRIENPYMYGQYLIRKEEYMSRGNCNVMELLHDTAATNVDPIASFNFDWRKVRRAKFGHGVSFSPDPSYANKQSSISNNVDRAMIFSDVLIGNSQHVTHSFKLPNNGYDTTMGNGDKVYVKYYDNEFYPKYAVYYSNNTALYRRRRY